MNTKMNQKTNDMGVWRIQLQGRVDEVLEFPHNVPSNAKSAQVDLGDVTYFNSSGIRNWVNWVAAVHGSNIEMTLERAPFSFIKSAVAVREVLPPWINVKSFFVNQYCPKCETETETLIENRDGVQLPEDCCPKCQTNMEREIAYSSILGNTLKKARTS